jgi:hypothetical protein
LALLRDDGAAPTPLSTRLSAAQAADVSALLAELLASAGRG